MFTCSGQRPNFQCQGTTCLRCWKVATLMVWGAPYRNAFPDNIGVCYRVSGKILGFTIQNNCLSVNLGVLHSLTMESFQVWTLKHLAEGSLMDVVHALFVSLPCGEWYDGPLGLIHWVISHPLVENPGDSSVGVYCISQVKNGVVARKGSVEYTQ